MVFLKDILRVPISRNLYHRYAKRYDINLARQRIRDEQGNNLSCIVISKDEANAIYKIYFECDYPKYKDLELSIKMVKDYFDSLSLN